MLRHPGVGTGRRTVYGTVSAERETITCTPPSGLGNAQAHAHVSGKRPCSCSCVYLAALFVNTTLSVMGVWLSIIGRLIVQFSLLSVNSRHYLLLVDSTHYLEDIPVLPESNESIHSSVDKWRVTEAEAEAETFLKLLSKLNLPFKVIHKVRAFFKVTLKVDQSFTVILKPYLPSKFSSNLEDSVSTQTISPFPSTLCLSPCLLFQPIYRPGPGSQVPQPLSQAR